MYAECSRACKADLESPAADVPRVMLLVASGHFIQSHIYTQACRSKTIKYIAACCSLTKFPGLNDIHRNTGTAILLACTSDHAAYATLLRPAATHSAMT